MTSYPYQQNNNLLYLTGFEEPNSALVMEKDSEGNVSETLFIEGNDEHSLLWSGPRADHAAVRDHFGIQELQEFLKLKRPNLVDFDENSCIGIVEGAKPLKEILHRQRLIKSPLEQKLMQKAGKVGADAFRETMRWSKGCNRESSLAAKMEFEAKLGGASGLAYVPVVAGGDRANIIHYVRNDRLIENNSMVLMDAGAKVHGYCSDITRTWPISGKFTPAQRELYEAVLRTQQRCIQAVSQWPQFPDVSLNDLNSVATVLFMDELGALGFTNPEKCVHKLFPHSIGHYIGLDLHDCPSISYDEKLKSGMAITIEPGLYVPADEQYPTRFHGIGIRIEDDLILSDTGCINMTAGVPREVEEIEDLLDKAL